MYGGYFQMYGMLAGLVIHDFSELPDWTGGLCLSLCLPWIMFHAGVMVEMKNLVSNCKAIVFRGMVDNLITLASVSLGTYYLFPLIGIDSLDFTHSLTIGVVFMHSSSFLFNFPMIPYPLIELIDDHSIVFGEGVLGITLSLILFKHVKTLYLYHLFINPSAFIHLCCYLSNILVASSFLGYSIGFFLSCAYVPKFVISQYFNRGYHLLFLKGATFVLFIPTYLCYVWAEYLNLSGALCVFFYGIAVANYIFPNDPVEKAMWRDDIHRIFTLLNALFWFWVGASSTAMKEWRSLEGNRIDVVGNASAVLIVTIIFGRLISVYPLSWCRQEKTKIEPLLTDGIFANQWRVPDLNFRWVNAKEKTKNHQPNPLLFNRWGLGKIEPQVMTWMSVEKAISHKRMLALGSAIVPSTLSYVFAYDQLKNSDNIQLCLAHMSIVVVHFCMSAALGVWQLKKEMELDDVSRIKCCFVFGYHSKANHKTIDEWI